MAESDGLSSVPRAAATTVDLIRGLVITARPKQWTKNVLVFAGPLASGMLLQPGVLPRVLLTFLGFTLMASGVYFLNDARDLDQDRQHVTKRNRPIPAGIVPVSLAYAAGFAALILGLGCVAAVNLNVLVMGLVYVGINVAYSLGLKHVAVVDLLIVAGGFMVRAFAGVLAIPEVPSIWFNLMALFGSLLLVGGKRAGERTQAGHDGTSGVTRKVQANYSDSYLQFVRDFSAAGLLMAYALMAYQKSDTATGLAEVALQASILPFLATVMLLVKRMDEGGGAAPEELVLQDRGVLLAGSLWVVIFALGVYLGSGATGT